MYFTSDGFTSSGVSLQMLVAEAYDAYAGDYATGGPPWASVDRFDVEARLDPEDIPQFRDLTLAQRRSMLQALLADRFQVTVHKQMRQAQGYVIQLAPGGPKLSTAEAGRDSSGGVLGYGCFVGGRGPVRGELQAKNCSMGDLSRLLCNTVAPKVVDRTGLAGKYDFDLHWSTESSSQPGTAMSAHPSDPAEIYMDLFSAIKQQLGLKLVPAKVSVEAVVIDHAEKPPDN
jgi:uncharacterized protein (TIGR03435 family)